MSVDITVIDTQQRKIEDLIKTLLSVLNDEQNYPLTFFRLSEKDFERLNFGLRSKLRRDSFAKLSTK